MTPTKTEVDKTLEQIASDHPISLARKAIREHRKEKHPIINQHSSWSPPPTLEVDRILDKSFKRI